MNKKQIITGIVILALIIVGTIYAVNNRKTELVAGAPEEILTETPGTENENTDTAEGETATPSETQQGRINAQKSKDTLILGHKAYGTGDYVKALAYYQEAATYLKNDLAYSGQFNVYMAQGNFVAAKTAIDMAISLNPLHYEYWNAKLTLLDEKTNASYTELKKVYDEALAKVVLDTKVNIVLHFAGIAEKNGRTNDAVAAWRYAIELYPANTAIYQQQINRIQ